jgi:formyltetrahydrofolate-dependent phosphoribosylglycinamide formyltransferase
VECKAISIFWGKCTKAFDIKNCIFAKMFQSLKDRWQVNNKQLFLILCTFAITGTLTAWLARSVTEWLSIDTYRLLCWLTEIVIIIFGYQVIVLIVGFSLGMLPFFWKYEKKILRRFGLIKKETKAFSNKKPMQLAIFASGAGSNAQQIITHFKNNPKVKIALIACNNPKAGVLSIAAREEIPVLLLEKEKFLETGYVAELQSHGIGMIILAGFLWKVPAVLIQSFPEKIINIHPALLPGYGGKGMYGNAVHSSVIAAKEKESGITIHYVDEKYDNGKIIFQSKCAVEENETPESLAHKIHQLEHTYYPKIISDLINSK